MEFQRDTLKFLIRLGNDLFCFLLILCFILRYLTSRITYFRDVEQMSINEFFYIY